MVKGAVNANESAIEQSFEEVEPTLANEAKDAVNANESAIEQSFEEVEPTLANEAKDAVNAELKQPQVRVIFEGKDAVLILYKAPRSRGFAWIEFLADGEQKEVDCSLLEIESILEG